MNADDEIEKILENLGLAAERYASTPDNSGAAVEVFCALVDTAEDACNEAQLLKAIELAPAIEEKCMPEDACVVRYTLSNAWAALHRIRNAPSALWSWAQPELLQQVYWLRAAIQHEGYAALPAARRGQIHCNLGNALSEIGRFVEAIVEWQQALREYPILGMARGNLGQGFVQYGMALYDGDHTYWFLRRGQEELVKAIAGGIGQDGATYPEALAHFQSYLEYVDDKLCVSPSDENILPPAFSLGETKEEEHYRQWSLDRNLFLNPLNDLGADSIAARDVLSLPSHRASDAAITFLAFFNQLKQEYAYARWCLYAGSTSGQVHFADRDVMLAFNADHALYTMGLEQVKTAFRSAYSLLDKVAYFVNDYWQLGIPERKVNFRSVWFEELKCKGAPPEVRQKLDTSENLPLRGLFWLAKDIYFEGLREVAHPNAKDLDSLRNHLEHKYVKVVDRTARGAHVAGVLEDRLARKVERDELVSKSCHLLQLSRSALIYLSLAMHVEESRARGHVDFTIPLDVGIYPDELKV